MIFMLKPFCKSMKHRRENMQMEPQNHARSIRGILSQMLTGKRRFWPNSANGIISPEEFERTLVRQRALADRTGLPFVLLAFDLSQINTAIEATLLLNILATNARLSDTVGWLGDRQQRVAILLADTKEGSLRVLERIEETFTQKAPLLLPREAPVSELHCEVLAYPEPPQHNTDEPLQSNTQIPEQTTYNSSAHNLAQR